MSYKKYLHWALKFLNSTYIGLYGALGLGTLSGGCTWLSSYQNSHLGCSLRLGALPRLLDSYAFPSDLQAHASKYGPHVWLFKCLLFLSEAARTKHLEQHVPPHGTCQAVESHMSDSSSVNKRNLETLVSILIQICHCATRTRIRTYYTANVRKD